MSVFGVVIVHHYWLITAVVLLAHGLHALNAHDLLLNANGINWRSATSLSGKPVAALLNQDSTEYTKQGVNQSNLFLRNLSSAPQHHAQYYKVPNREQQAQKKLNPGYGFVFGFVTHTGIYRNGL